MQSSLVIRWGGTVLLDLPLPRAVVPPSRKKKICTSKCTAFHVQRTSSESWRSWVTPWAMAPMFELSFVAFIILSVKVVYFVCKYIIFDVSTMSWCFGLSFENLRNFKVSDRPRVMGLLYPKACQAWAMGGECRREGCSGAHRVEWWYVRCFRIVHYI